MEHMEPHLDPPWQVLVYQASHLSPSRKMKEDLADVIGLQLAALKTAPVSESVFYIRVWLSVVSCPDPTLSQRKGVR